MGPTRENPSTKLYGKMVGPKKSIHICRPTILAAAILAMLSLGCVSIVQYQPGHGMHHPVAIASAPDNFAGLRILVSCLAHEEHLPREDAVKLCRLLAKEFRTQGAQVEHIVPSRSGYEEPSVFDGAPPDLRIEIESRREREYQHPASSCASNCCYSMLCLSPTVGCLMVTAFTGIYEYTFTQKVRILGSDSNVLAEQVFREEFVEYRGVGIWSVQWLLDWLRADANKLANDTVKRRFSNDFYGHIRQLAFNARTRAEILKK